MSTQSMTRMLTFALLALGACTSSLAPNERADVTVVYQGSGSYVRPAHIVVSLQFGGKVVALDSADFASTDGQFEAPAHSFRAPVSGTVQVVLRSAGGDVIAQGSRAVMLERNWQYGATLWVARGDPRSMPWVVCVPSVQGIPVSALYRAELGDSIFISWGGLPRGAVC